MTWWLRFCLGLPARPQDVQEFTRSFPELIAADSKLNERLLVPLWPPGLIREFELEDLRRWLRAADLPRPHDVGSPENCPAEECPLRKGPPPAQAQSDVALLRLMGVGGTHKPPRDEFLNLVRRVHRDQQIREVILTDPYVYLDLSERGQPGGVLGSHRLLGCPET